MKIRVIALALAALGSQAFAATTASITTGSFNAVLRDLNTADGVAAGLTWDASWSLYAGSNYSQQIGYQLVHNSWGNSLEAKFGAQVYDWQSASAPATSLSSSAVGGLGSLSISLDGNGLPSASVQLSVGSGTMAYATTQFSRGFWLTAGTQVSFSILADSSLTGTGYAGSWTPPAGVSSFPSHSWANSSVGMSVGSLNSSLNLSGSNGFNFSPAAFETVGEADQLKLIVRNTTTTDQYYWFNSYAQVNVQEYLDPATAAMVPEPSTYALMALGLLGVAGAARRRKA